MKDRVKEKTEEEMADLCLRIIANLCEVNEGG
jgi:hypothetical protein